MYILSVLVEHPVHALDTTFSYLSMTPVHKGVRVSIIFNRRPLIGYVLNVEYTNADKQALEEAAGFRYSFINKVIDEEPLLNEELMALGERIARMTLSPRIACYQAMLPPTLKPSTHKSIGIKHQKAVRIVKSGEPQTDKQQACYQYLKQSGIHYLKDLPFSRSPLEGLIKQGLAEIYEAEVLRNPFTENNLKVSGEVTLTVQQKQIINGIMAKPERISLIHGVTGSGKTEIYLALTKEMRKQGKNVIMLVPEISLTPMMVKIFKSRFHEDVAILHSRLSQGEKYDEYRRIKKGKVHIVVGARSAIFAPLDNIGLIIMDEEHDTSYKQENKPRYHTLQIAKMRSDYYKARVVLGSATPSLESYARAQKGYYDLYELPERINKKPLPHVDVVDMAQETRAHNYSLISRLMKSRIEDTLDRGEQVILLLNKRGYASFVKCSDCGEIIKCPHCDVTMTYHKSENRLKCHYCEYSMPLPETCPSCHSKSLKKIGYGTQKIEEEIAETFQKAKIIRFDFDTTRNKNEHLRLLESFQNQEANILLGTQMIAKGLDFPNVTFVGVLNADLSLTIPDFRASERTFQLLCQVSGRSGRAEKSGSVVIQTYNSDHYAITTSASQDYHAFYEEEMKYRKQAMYPPYCHLVAIIVQSKKSLDTKTTAIDIKNYLSDQLDHVKILGPTQSAIYKMQDIYRERILIKYFDAKPIYQVLGELNDYYNKQKNGKVIVACDFNPYTQI